MFFREYIPAGFSSWMEYNAAKAHKSEVIRKVKTFCKGFAFVFVMAALYIADVYVETMF